MKCYLLLLLIFTTRIFAQDTCNLFFKGLSFELRTDVSHIMVTDSSGNPATLFRIGSNKFFYLQSSKDSLPVEFGQLALFRINDKCFLLREGPWVLKGENETTTFDNSGSRGTVAESVYEYMNVPQEKRKKKFSRTVGATHKNN